MKDKKSGSFFDGHYEKLTRVHGSGKREDFDKLAVVIMSGVKRYSGWMCKHYPIRSIDSNDYVQIALETCWNHLSKYEYICPECDFRSSDFNHYVSHCNDAHAQVLVAKVKLEKYLDYMMKRYMRNFMLKFVRAKSRCDWNTISIEDVDDIEYLFRSSFSEEQSSFNLTVEKLVNLVERDRDEKIRFFVKKCLEGQEPSDIYVCMAENGMYCNKKSARYAIEAFRKRGRLARYKALLV